MSNIASTGDIIISFQVATDYAKIRFARVLAWISEWLSRAHQNRSKSMWFITIISTAAFERGS